MAHIASLLHRLYSANIRRFRACVVVDLSWQWKGEHTAVEVRELATEKAHGIQDRSSRMKLQTNRATPREVSA